jgi:hypothetical protein
MTSATPPASGGIDTYSRLIAFIGNFLSRDDLADRIPDFIRLAEIDLQRDLELREGDKVQDNKSTVVGQDFIDLPEDLLEPRILRFNSDPIRLVEITSMDKWTSIRQTFSAISKPMSATQVGQRLYLAPTPGEVVSYTLFYRARIMPLSANNQSNRVLKDAPDALIYGALVHAATYIGDDERIQMFGVMYSTFKESYKRLEWRSRTSGGPLRVRVDTGVDDRHSVGGD